jgi:exonuclease SbcD
MGVSPLRILLLADTHLGFDLPFRPRVERRRRGPDFFANFERALRPAMDGEVDLVVHGGDLLFRSKVPARLVEMAFAPLARVGRRGIPVYLVPGNHERSRIPYPLLALHRGVHIFDRPRTFPLEVRGVRVALSGFPFHRPGVRGAFRGLLDQVGSGGEAADLRLLCLHEAVEGARVGPAGYTFRDRPDVIRGRDLPPAFAAYLSGHIHRHQVLTRDLSGRRLPAPFFYPGSIERTSRAELGEPKGYLLIEVAPGRAPRWRFRELPTRPLP